ncbi:type VI secretion system protein ImpF [Chitinivorax tropicus]|uniref:Type VI secretion system protein ImpF n=1 Tax=Chitinivorax tropicus TaxID=714531 RepID=A0A840MTM5_9PROT|nr:type VI secretion system baseplate subunit TssE [Chitinivorax tropicus]MBB5020142.1 type VI secretion system protein ImpF [Chitinivorax tropicus]
MAELTAQERLQPSLLDRLTDDEVGNRQEPREKRVLSMRALRAAVLRDLNWLLNTVCLDTVQSLTEYPHVASSVLNFGMQDLSGRTHSGLDLGALERSLRQSIWDYEPRIVRNTVRVRALAEEQSQGGNMLVFEIEGELWGQPLPERLYLKTAVNLETGEKQVLDGMGALG